MKTTGLHSTILDPKTSGYFIRYIIVQNKTLIMKESRKHKKNNK